MGDLVNHPAIYGAEDKETGSDITTRVLFPAGQENFQMEESDNNGSLVTQLLTKPTRN